MAKSGIDAEVNNTGIFRKDFPTVIALRRDLAQVSPVRLALDANGYVAGQVLVRKTSDGLFYKYSAASGSAHTSNCVLFESVTADDQPATGGALARGLFAGYLFSSKLIDLDSTAKSELGGIEYTDASGVAIFKF